MLSAADGAPANESVAAILRQGDRLRIFGPSDQIVELAEELK